MKPCRDCNQPASPAARSCPHCGIVNPVVQWIALPDGSHHTLRMAPDPVAAAAAIRGVAMPAPRMPAPLAPRLSARRPSAAAKPALPESGEEIDAIRQCSTVFFVLAAINGAAGYFLGSALLLEAAIMAVLALLLRKLNSRVAAVLLVIYAALTTLSKVMMLLDGGGMRIGWIWMWVLVTGAAVKAAIATFKLRQQPSVAMA